MVVTSVVVVDTLVVTGSLVVFLADCLTSSDTSSIFLLRLAFCNVFVLDLRRGLILWNGAALETMTTLGSSSTCSIIWRRGATGCAAAAAAAADEAVTDPRDTGTLLSAEARDGDTATLLSVRVREGPLTLAACTTSSDKVARAGVVVVVVLLRVVVGASVVILRVVVVVGSVVVVVVGAAVVVVDGTACAVVADRRKIGLRPEKPRVNWNSGTVISVVGISVDGTSVDEVSVDGASVDSTCSLSGWKSISTKTCSCGAKVLTSSSAMVVVDGAGAGVTAGVVTAMLSGVERDCEKLMTLPIGKNVGKFCFGTNTGGSTGEPSGDNLVTVVGAAGVGNLLSTSAIGAGLLVVAVALNIFDATNGLAEVGGRKVTVEGTSGIVAAVRLAVDSVKLLPKTNGLIGAVVVVEVVGLWVVVVVVVVGLWVVVVVVVVVGLWVVVVVVVVVGLWVLETRTKLSLTIAFGLGLISLTLKVPKKCFLLSLFETLRPNSVCSWLRSSNETPTSFSSYSRMCLMKAPSTLAKPQLTATAGGNSLITGPVSVVNSADEEGDGSDFFVSSKSSFSSTYSSSKSASFLNCGSDRHVPRHASTTTCFARVIKNENYICSIAAHILNHLHFN